jgi:transcriptional regulator with XRE-family HTH domain
MEGLLPRKLLMARLERGLTLRGAAEQTGVSKETISELERGLRKPHPPTLYKIAQGYGIHVSDLLQEDQLAVPLAG